MNPDGSGPKFITRVISHYVLCFNSTFLQELKEYCESVLSEEIQLETCLELLLLADAQLATKLKVCRQRSYGNYGT
jgi:hypothetical protein